MAINNVPPIGPYTKLEPFRFWCQKVIPLVYDESLSYYELLCKVVDYLNKTMEDVDLMASDMAAFREAYAELIVYVNTYFDNLDVSEEINRKLDQMAADGTLTALLVPIASPVITAWLAANITEPVGVVIDKSLTVEGAAADSKAVGDALDGALLNRGKLTSEDDMDLITLPGVYYVDSVDGYPDNLPFETHSGRILVVKAATASAAVCSQLYFTNYVIPRIAFRVSKSYYDPSDAWTGVKWTEITLNSLLDRENVINEKRAYIPLVRGTFQTNGRYSTGVTNRMRVLNSYHDLFGFQLAGYKIKFNYYNGPFDYDEATEEDVPSNFLYAAEWQDIDDPVDPEKGLWFTFVIAKQDDADITAEDITDIREDLIAYQTEDPEIFMQTETVPYNALEYHKKWNDLLDGSVVKRTLLGYAYDDTDYPIYSYEIHTNRNAMSYNYQNITYDGSNAQYPRKKVLIFAGTHGNEKCTPMDALTLARELVHGSLQDIGAMFDWYFVPLVNPWGYSHVNLDSDGHIIYRYGDVAETIEAAPNYNAGVRTNSLGMDINRDFSDVTYDNDDITYGFQTDEAQLIQPLILAHKWDIFLDIHQNNQDKNDAMGDGANAFAGIGYVTSDDAAYLAKVNDMYLTIDRAAKITNKKLAAFFRRHNTSGQSFVTWIRKACNAAGVDLGIACNYMSGFPTGSYGNTLHQDIAAEVPMTIETSELAWTYSQLSNQTNTPRISWYNPVACSCSSTAVCELIRSIAKKYAYNDDVA